ncbi:MAG: menaquinone biosynthesis protein [Desulfobacterales bacterium]|nr:menaquinone biosynthesis protein [Desulfobacterales bacterium]
MTQVPVGRISYINVAPVYYGLDRGKAPSWLRMITQPPSRLNSLLTKGEVVASPVSSAAYARNASQWLLLPDLSISCDGPVLSVLFASRVPMEELDGRRVLVTEESETSVDLLKILLKEKGVHPKIKTGRVQTPDALSDDLSGCLVIGDAALVQNWPKKFPFVYDLGAEWKRLTGLPFVFAVWAIRRDFCQLAPAVVERLVELFHDSRHEGQDNMDRVISDSVSRTGLPLSTLMRYFHYLGVELKTQELEGMQRFFDIQYRMGLISSPVTPAFTHLSSKVVVHCPAPSSGVASQSESIDAMESY